MVDPMATHARIKVKFLLLLQVSCGIAIGVSTNEKLSKTEGGLGLCWTKWINKYRGSEGIDDEVFTPTDLYIYNICQKPMAVDVARVDGKAIAEKLNCFFYGCSCKDYEQESGSSCSDYLVRFLCPCTNVTVKTEVLCENGPPKKLECKPNQIIEVRSAFYGVIWLSGCGIGAARPQCHGNSAQLVKLIQERCHGKSTCSMAAEPSIHYHGSPCSSEGRSLYIEYGCLDACLHNQRLYFIGQSFTDRVCRKRCVCVGGGRTVCVPVCSENFGVPCQDDEVVRFKSQPSYVDPSCKCLVPKCIKYS